MVDRRSTPRRADDFYLPEKLIFHAAYIYKEDANAVCGRFAYHAIVVRPGIELQIAKSLKEVDEREQMMAREYGLKHPFSGCEDCYSILMKTAQEGGE